MNRLGRTLEKTCDILKDMRGLDHEDSFHEIDNVTGIEWPEVIGNSISRDA